MTLTIQLTPEQEARLEEIAAREGLPAAEIALNAVKHLLAFAEPPPTVGQQILAQWEKEGALGGAWAERADITDSASFAHALRREAETRFPAEPWARQ